MLSGVTVDGALEDFDVAKIIESLNLIVLNGVEAVVVDCVDAIGVEVLVVSGS